MLSQGRKSAWEVLGGRQEAADRLALFYIIINSNLHFSESKKNHPTTFLITLLHKLTSFSFPTVLTTGFNLVQQALGNGKAANSRCVNSTPLEKGLSEEAEKKEGEEDEEEEEEKGEKQLGHACAHTHTHTSLCAAAAAATAAAWMRLRWHLGALPHSVSLVPKRRSASCHWVDDDYLHQGLKGAQALLAIGAEMLQLKDFKSCTRPKNHYQSLAVWCLLKKGWVWKGGTGDAGEGRAYEIFIPSCSCSLPASPTFPTPHAFLATAPLLSHDKVMSLWSEHLLIMAIKGLCGSLGIWDFAWHPITLVSSSCPGLGSHQLRAELLAKLANFCDSCFLNYTHKTVKTIVIAILTDLRCVTEALKKQKGWTDIKKGKKHLWCYPPPVDMHTCVYAQILHAFALSSPWRTTEERLSKPKGSC